MLAVGRDAAARYDDMGVRMMSERRSPGVEHGGKPDAGAEVLGVGRDGDQGLGGGFEQQVIDDCLVLIGDVGDRSRQGEDDMEIGHGQEFGRAVGQPLLGSGGLALRAMPVAAEAMRVTGEGMRLVRGLLQAEAVVVGSVAEAVDVAKRYTRFPSK